MDQMCPRCSRTSSILLVIVAPCQAGPPTTLGVTQSGSVKSISTIVDGDFHGGSQQLFASPPDNVHPAAHVLRMNRESMTKALPFAPANAPHALGRMCANSCLELFPTGHCSLICCSGPGPSSLADLFAGRVAA